MCVCVCVRECVCLVYMYSIPYHDVSYRTEKGKFICK